MRRLSLTAVFLSLAAAGCSAPASTYDLDGGDVLTVGRLYVAQRGCGTCHQTSAGDGGAPDGVLSGQTTPVPGTGAFGSNLTPDVATGLGAWAGVEILRAMRYGTDNQQMELCLAMPRYDGADGGMPFMTDLEGDAIVAYLGSLPAVARAIPQSVCPPIKYAPLDMLLSDQSTADAAPDGGASDGSVGDGGIGDGASDGAIHGG